MTRRLSTLFAMVAALAAAMALLVWQAPASQAAACTSAKSGVTVVVDYKSLGGGVVTACAAGDPGSALQALTSAGFSATRASREFSGYFLCRINGKPATDPCVKASPASAYWSFWHGSAGGSWTYSQVGVAGWDPQPGTAVGFSFGAGAQPGIKPPAISTGGGSSKPSPKPTPSTPAPKPSSSASLPAVSPSPSTPKGAPKPSAAQTGSSPSRTSSAGSAGTSGPNASGSGASSAGAATSGASGRAATSAIAAGPGSSSAVGTSGAAGTSSATGAGNSAGSNSRSSDGGAAVAGAAPTNSSSSSGNTPVAIGAGVIAAAGLGGAGLLAARRRHS